MAVSSCRDQSCGEAFVALCGATSPRLARWWERGRIRVMAEAEFGAGRLVRTLMRGLALLLAACLGLADAYAQQPRSAAPAVPVQVARAARQDVPFYLNGLGLVQAFNSVLVRSRVDGTLMLVPVAEGQEVSQGDVLA